MTILDWLLQSMQKLKRAGVDSPRRDALVLIEDLLSKDRSWVTAHGEFELNQKQTAALDQKIARRLKHEPLAYIRGKAWFYGRFFKVNKNVMIPRPESEAFIEIIKKLKPKKIVDVGTGSGCLAITTALELPEAEILAIDSSQQALKVAKLNSEKHCIKNISFLYGNLLEPIVSEEKIEAFLVNLPYVPENLITSPEIKYEPTGALFSGKEGLNHYKEFWNQLSKLQHQPTYVLTESLETQHVAMKKMAKTAGYKLAKTEILVQLFCREGF